MKLNFTSTKLILAALPFYAAAFFCAGAAGPPTGDEAFAPHSIGGATDFNHWHYFALLMLCCALGFSIAGARQWLEAENGSCRRWLGLGAADEKAMAEIKALLGLSFAALPVFFSGCSPRSRCGRKTALLSVTRAARSCATRFPTTAARRH